MSQLSKNCLEQYSLFIGTNYWYAAMDTNYSSSCNNLDLNILELSVGLTSTPSGPNYPAATWITFQCQATHGSGIYRYKWRVYCASTGVLIFESIAGIETSFRMKSTPSVCYDRIECVAEDTVLPLAGSASETITSVTGKPCVVAMSTALHH